MRTCLAPLALTVLLASPAAAQCLQYRLDAVAPTTLGSFGLGLAADGSRACIGGAGFASVWERTPLGWTHTAQLPAPPGFLTFFGAAVDVREDRVLVGRFGSPGPPTLGAATLYQKRPNGWNVIAQLSATPNEVGGSFGASVALGADFAVVGAATYEGSGGSNKAYVFEQPAPGVPWVQTAVLTDGDPTGNCADGSFGSRVAADDVRILVGDMSHCSGGIVLSGAAYVFERVAGTNSWTQSATLLPNDPDPYDRFGEAVAILGDVAVVGSSYEQDAGPDSGSAYVFRRGPTGWAQEAKLKPNDVADGRRFGHWVSLAPDRILVGAPSSLYEPGDAYVFERDVTSWRQVQHLRGTRVTPRGEFGDRGVFADGGLLIAAPRNELDTGAVFVFDDSFRRPFCNSTPNSTGASAEIEACGSTSLTLGTLRLSSEPVPNGPGVFFYGPGQGQQPFDNGFLCVTGPSYRLVPTNAAGGVLSTNYDLSAPPTQAAQIVSGSTWNFQAWFRDPAGGGALANLSNGVALRFIP